MSAPPLAELQENEVIISSPCVWKLSPETTSDLAGVTQLLGQGVELGCSWVSQSCSSGSLLVVVTYLNRLVLTGQLC